MIHGPVRHPIHHYLPLEAIAKAVEGAGFKVI